MIRGTDPTYDVYVSYSPLNVDTARDIAASFRKAGYEPYLRDSDDAVGSESEQSAWNALGECRAAILVVTGGRDPSAVQMVEFGAARAWTKPIFLVLEGSSTTALTGSLAKYPLYPLSRLEEVIYAVRSSTWPLDDEEKELLKDLYKDYGVPVDQFFQNPAVADDFTVRFEKQAKRRVTEERLLTELLRMRKSGRLPRLARRASEAASD